MSGKAKINEYGFRMTDVKIAVRLRWESSPDLSASGSKMFLAKMRMYLRVLPWFMELAKESFFKYRFTTSNLIKYRF
jgi:hypothetical protein